MKPGVQTKTRHIHGAWGDRGKEAGIGTGAGRRLSGVRGGMFGRARNVGRGDGISRLLDPPCPADGGLGLCHGGCVLSTSEGHRVGRLRRSARGLLSAMV